MDRERLDNWCKKAMLGLVLAILVFGPTAFGAMRMREFLVIQGLTLGVILVWLIRFWLSPSYRLLWPPICWAVLVFVAYAILQYLQADLEYPARWELIRILIYAILFLAIVSNLSGRGSSRAVGLTLVTVAAAIASLAVYQYFTHSPQILYLPKPKEYFGRASGTYICPNHLAGFLEMILPIGLAFSLVGKVGHLTRIGLGYATVVILAGIGVTLSRGGWLAAGLALVAFLAVLAWQRIHRVAAVVALIAILAIGGAFVVKNRHFQKRIEMAVVEGKPNDVRFLMWRPAIQMWNDHFWWGVGPAHFDYRFRHYRPEALQTRPEWAHNDYLNLLADWGLAGGLMVAGAWLLLGLGIQRTWKYVRRSSHDLTPGLSNRFAWLIGASTGLLAILLHSFVDFNMNVPANAIVCVTLMAIVSGHWRYATDRFWFKPGWPVRILATLVGLAALIYLGRSGLTRHREAVILNQAAKFAKSLPEQLDLLKQAHALEPMNFETTYLVGELLRQQSWAGNDDYAALAAEAMKWFERGMRLNPYDPGNPLRYGMCLDWLGRHQEAAAHFEHARRLDTNYFYIVAHVGWHFVQIGDYTTARNWFERSLKLKPSDNPVAQSYLDIVNRRLAEAAAQPKPGTGKTD